MLGRAADSSNGTVRACVVNEHSRLSLEVVLNGTYALEDLGRKDNRGVLLDSNFSQNLQIPQLKRDGMPHDHVGRGLWSRRGQTRSTVPDHEGVHDGG
jgi:hypothetical protein